MSIDSAQPSAQTDQKADQPPGQPSAVIYALLGIALTAFVIGLCVMPTSANDLFWQLRTGRETILNHQVPRHDTYSWTAPGTPWVVHEWLSFVLFWWSYQFGGGFAGVWLLQTALVTVTGLILFAIICKETGGAPLTAFLLSIGAATTASGFFQPRPHLFTYLFLAIAVALLIPARRDSSKMSRLWILVPMTALWANLHAGVLLNVVILAGFAIGDAMMAVLTHRDSAERAEALRSPRKLGLIALACAGATLATPYGWHVYQNFSATLLNSTAMNMVAEWTSPDFHDLFGKIFEGMLAVVLFALVGTRLKRDPVEIVLILGLMHVGLASSRNVPLFALIAVPLAARHIQSALAGLLRGNKEGPEDETSLFGKSPSLISVAAVSIAFAFIPVLRVMSALDKSHSHAHGVLNKLAAATIVLDSFPEGASRFIEAEDFPKSLHLYNTYDIGGFLIWRLPHYPVFIDGRADVYFGGMLTKSMDLAKLRFDWAEKLNEYQAEMAIVPSRDAEAHLFMASPDWALVYADRPFTAKRKADTTDDNGLIFLKRTPRNAPLIARCLQDCPVARGQQSNGPMR